MSLLIIPLVYAALELACRVLPHLRRYAWHFRLLLALFFLACLAIYTGTQWGWMPAQFHYGNGILRVTSDALNYQLQAKSVAAGLRSGSLDSFLDWQKSNYSKVLGIGYLLFGTSGLTGMLLNSVFYLISVASVLFLTKRLAGDRAALTAVWLFGIWPSFLAHATQTIRWVETTAGLELMMLGCVLLLSRSPFVPALIVALLGYVPLLLDLPYVARLTYLCIALFVPVALVASVGRPHLRAPALRLAVFGIAVWAGFYVVWVAVRVQPPAIEEAVSVTAEAEPLDEGEEWKPSPVRTRVEQIDTLRPIVLRLNDYVRPLLSARDGFIRQAAHSTRHEGLSIGTTIGQPRRLHDVFELIGNLPSAYSAALFAPTPVMLLTAPQGVSNLRRFVLVEMLGYYALLAAALIGLVVIWRRNAEARIGLVCLLWFVLVIYTLLGTVVVNAGTLYRFRVPYVGLLLVFAAAGIDTLRRLVRARRQAVVEKAGA